MAALSALVGNEADAYVGPWLGWVWNLQVERSPWPKGGTQPLSGPAMQMLVVAVDAALSISPPDSNHTEGQLVQGHTQAMQHKQMLTGGLLFAWPDSSAEQHPKQGSCMSHHELHHDRRLHHPHLCHAR